MQDITSFYKATYFCKRECFYLVDINDHWRPAIGIVKIYLWSIFHVF